MSQHQQHSQQSSPAQAVNIEGNAMGLAGFIIALSGIVLGATTGFGAILCPVGLILSIIGLGRQPRGFAIAGVVLGLLGTCGGLVVVVLVVVFGAAVLGMLGIAIYALSSTEQWHITRDMAVIAVQVEQFKEQNNSIPPANLSMLTLAPDDLTDPWGNRYRYVLIDDSSSDPGYDIISNGPDGDPETIDDIRLTTLDEAWEDAVKQFERKFERVEGGESIPEEDVSQKE